MLELTQVQYKNTTEEASKQVLKRLVNKKNTTTSEFCEIYQAHYLYRGSTHC